MVARQDLDRRIVESWQAHEAAEPDISTERLMEMVRTDTGAEPDRQIEALQRAGTLREPRAMAEHRDQYVCQACGAVGYGNATCRDCVAQWPRFGHPQSSVDSLLRALGDQPPEAPFGTRSH